MGLGCKSRKSRNTWSNRQIWPWSTDEGGQRLIEFFQENTLVIANTLFRQHKRRLYTWTSSDGWHQNHIDYILCSQRWRSSIQSAKTRLGADCGSDHLLLIAKFRLKLKKVEKTTRPFRYDLNQIRYEYTVKFRSYLKNSGIINMALEIFTVSLCFSFIIFKLMIWTVLSSKGTKKIEMKCSIIVLDHIYVYYSWVLSHLWFFATSWTVACQAPLSMEFSRQEYWSGLPFPSLGDLTNSGIKLESPA